MTMTPRSTPRAVVLTIIIAAALSAGVCFILGVFEPAAAQGPFGIVGATSGSSASTPGGITGWLLAEQAAFYREFTGLIRAAKADGHAVYALLGVSFAYGIFHAAGPGHGKAVISAYLVANRETWRRGVILSFASALLQALAAIAIVGIAAVVLGVTAKMMGHTVRVIEVASYLLIVAVGARLTWVKGRGFIGALRDRAATSNAHNHENGGDRTRHHHHNDNHDSHPHPHQDTCAHDHHDGEMCDHVHGPEPLDLAGSGGWRRGLSAIFAVGLRPCSGAILVLVFTLAQGLFWLGVVATLAMGLGTAMTVTAIATLAVGAASIARRLATTRGGFGTLALRGIEVAAAIVVVMFGLLLLAGYLASEPLFLV
jgi:nickel/cobalt exporter